MKIGNKEFDLSSHCYIMGILNVTPKVVACGDSERSAQCLKDSVLNTARQNIYLKDILHK